MRTLLITTIAALTLGTAAYAQTTDVTFNSHVTKATDTAAVYSLDATGDFSVGIMSTVDMLAGGKLAFTDFPDSDAVELTEWYIGAGNGTVDVTAGKQSDVFTGSLMNELGGAALANPANGEYSLVVSATTGSVYVGYDDATSDWTNLQVAAHFTPSVMLAQNVTVVADYQNAGDALTIGAEVVGSFNQLSTGVVATYADASETLGYEGTIGWSAPLVDLAAFAGGTNNTDVVDYIGASAGTMYNNVELWSEMVYNIESEDSDVAVGVSFNF